MKSTKRALKSIASAVPLLACVSALSPHPLAHSQEVVGKAERVDKIEKVEVTGTRLPPPNLESPSPLMILNAEDIRLEGSLPLENILSSLPQVFGTQGTMISNGASGTAQVDLRGLGSFRTLVLVNGRRMPRGDFHAPGADLNQIPSPLIRRIELLTGGASAVYGSDAIAGVVNFVMDDRFEGVRGEVNYSFHNHAQHNPHGIADIIAARAATNPGQFTVPGDKRSDGESFAANLTIGGKFADGRGNGTVYLGYRRDEALLQSERDFSACTLGSSAAGFFCAGALTGYPAVFLDLATRLRWTVANEAGGVRPWQPQTDPYNYGPLNHYRRPTERYNLNAFFHYDVNPETRVYAELGAHDDGTVAQIAPSGLFGTEETRVAHENPLLSAEWRSALGITAPGTTANLIIFRRNVEGGGRMTDIQHTSHREVIGVKGTAAPDWNYDLYYQFARVAFQDALLNDFSRERGRRALDVVADPTTGSPVCASVLDGSDPGCVPYNVWSLGAVTPEALAYLQTPGMMNGFTSQALFGATLTGDLGRHGIAVPGAESGVAVALGVEQRTEKGEIVPDVALTSGDLAGRLGPTPASGGSYTVREIFAEARVPIRDGFDVSGSFRYSDYDTGQNTDTFGFVVGYSPSRRIRIRGSYQRAVRVADLIEAFQPATQFVARDFEDPCAGPAPPRPLEDCLRSGMTAAQYGLVPEHPLRAVNVLNGGNRALAPESADTYTAGIVLQSPRRWSLTVDYFDIRIEEVIAVPFGPISLDQCLDTGDERYCRLVRRDPVHGSLWLDGGLIDDTFQNLSRIRTSGIDVVANYGLKLPEMGRVDIDAAGTYLRSLSIEQFPGLGTIECAGLFAGACGTPNPRWRHRVRATWRAPWAFEVVATWRYLSGVLNTSASDNPVPPQPVFDTNRRLDARNYLDLAASWQVTRHMTLMGGISNLLDRDPPVAAVNSAGFFNGNTYPQVYDALGRRIFANLTVRF